MIFNRHALIPTLILTALTSAPRTPGQVPSDQPPEIKPFVLSLGPDSAVLHWVTPSELVSKGKLYSSGEEFSFHDAVATQFHRHEFENLRAGTSYRYQIDNVFEGTFSTPDTSNEFRLVALGHTHGSEPPDHYPDELLVARVEELDPDFIIHTGDTVWRATYSDFARHFFKLFSGVLAHKPVYIAPGNHDMWRGPFDDFMKLFPHKYEASKEAYYRIDYKNLRLLFTSYMTLGLPQSTQMDWIERELASSTKEFNVVVWGGTHLPKERNEAFFDLLSRHRVDLLLGGDGGGVRIERVRAIPYV